MAGQRSVLIKAVAGGIDHNWWQSERSFSEAVNAAPSRRGAMEKLRGWYPLVGWSSALAAPVASMGVFSRENATDLVLDYSGSLQLVTGKTRATLPPSALGWGRFSASTAVGASIMSMVGSRLYICNGRDRNLKYDGRKLSPVGVSAPPEEPEVQILDLTDDITGSGDPITVGRFTAPTPASDAVRMYAYTWVNEAGTESNLGLASEPVSPVTDDGEYIPVIWLVGDAPSDDCVSRNLYVSTDQGLTWSFKARVPGTAEAMVQDYPALGDATRVPPATGANTAPETATFAFEYRGRAYYQPVSRQDQLDFSSLGSPEAVPLENSISVGHGDGDQIRAFLVAEDYVLLFKRRSVYTLTTNADGLPVVRKLTDAAGTPSRFSVQSIDGRTYWLDEDGVYVTNGSTVKRLTDRASRAFENTPRAALDQAVSWADYAERRVVFCTPWGPASSNKQWFIVDVDAGIVTRATGMDVVAAVTYQGRTILSAYHNDGGYGWDLVVDQHTDGRGDDGVDGECKTDWLDFGDPMSEKVITRLDVIYTQRCNVNVTLNIYADWDERAAGWTGTASLVDPAAPLWDTATYTAGDTYDYERVRTQRVDIVTPAGEARLKGRAFALGWTTGGTAKPWSILGFRVYFEDLGRPAQGALDDIGTC